MGIYLNPGNEEFYRAVNSRIYVDKTELITYTNQYINTEHRDICVTRPRRFGKSMAANMLTAYYSRGCDSENLFSGLKISGIENFDVHLNKYNVIHLNIQKFMGRSESVQDMIELISTKVTRELKREFDNVTYYEDDLVSVLEEIFSQTSSSFVFIIDEWDCVFRDNRINKDSQREYLDYLRNLLKDQPYCSLAYMTGILPIKKYGEHSALNMFDEYSMTNQRELAEFTGFTEEEVSSLCLEYDMPYDDMKMWYDGYDLKGMQVYNPRSVVMSLTGHDFDSYWTKTETYEALKKYIQTDMYDLRKLVTRLIAGEHIEVNKEFVNCIEDGGWEPVMDAINNSEKLLALTLSGDESGVAAMIEQAHQENTSILQYNDENSLACIVSLAYYSAKKDYYVYRELAGGKGYSDMVFVPRRNNNMPAIVVELKWNKSVDTAISQIKQKQYVECLKDYRGEVILVGISYDCSDSKDVNYKKHNCKIENVHL